MMLCVEAESLCPPQAELHLPQEEKEEDVTDGVIIVYKMVIYGCIQTACQQFVAYQTS